MTAFGCEPMPNRYEPSPELVLSLEDHIGTDLPTDYRSFVLEYGGVWARALAPIQEITPCGQHATIECFYGFMTGKPRAFDLKWQCDLAEGAPVAIPIAAGAFSSQIFLFTSDQERLGVKRGATYFWDGDNRSSWPDETFYSSFEDLSPELERYLELRRNGQLPQKPDALSDFYIIADTFTSFLESCKPWQDEVD